MIELTGIVLVSGARPSAGEAFFKSAKEIVLGRSTGLGSKRVGAATGLGAITRGGIGLDIGAGEKRGKGSEVFTARSVECRGESCFGLGQGHFGDFGIEGSYRAALVVFQSAAYDGFKGYILGRAGAGE